MNLRITALLTITTMLAAGVAAHAAADVVTPANDTHTALKLWPDAAPGETGDIGEEGEQNRNPKLDAPVVRWQNVSVPTLTLYPAPKDANTGAMVVIAPGGGYSILAWNLEGTEIAQWLNTLGVNAAVLKYRVPRRKDREKHEAPLQDAQRAIRLVRAHAEEWSVDPQRIGILGFSAGGHLAAAASTNDDQPAYEPIDEADKLSPRPDFTVLIYPAYLTAEKNDPTKLAPEIRVDDKTPPAIMIMTADDGVGVESAIGYFLALKNAKVPAELHVYPRGGHGYGLRETGEDISSWPDRVADWMKRSGLLEARK